MDFNVYHHNVSDQATKVDLNQVLALLRELYRKAEKIMEGNQDILDAIAAADTKLDAQDAALTGIAGDVAFLKSVVPAAGGMTQEQADQVRTALGSITSKIDANTAKAEAIDAETDSSGA